MVMNTTDDLGPLSIVVVDIGNTKIGMGRWVEGSVEDVERLPIGDRDGTKKALTLVREKCENQQRQAIVIASVVPEQTVWLKGYIEDDLDLQPFVVGENIDLPAELGLKQPIGVGVDRVCSAAAAYERTRNACTVVQVGSAVTIDMIDDNGVFQGGAILPGISAQARSLAEYTAQLPLVEPAMPFHVLGKLTEEAILSGLYYGLAGAIRGIVEEIATVGNKWPQVIVTGGGCDFLKDKLDFADNWVEDLCLMGVGLAYVRKLARAAGNSEETI